MSEPEEEGVTTLDAPEPYIDIDAVPTQGPPPLTVVVYGNLVQP